MEKFVLNISHPIIFWSIWGVVGLLLATSKLKLKNYFDWRTGIGLPLFGFSLYVVITNAPEYALGLSVLGTLLMAGIALLAIKENHEQVRRERYERKLTSISTWANEIIKCETALPITPLPIGELANFKLKFEKDMTQDMLDYFYKNSMSNLAMKYQELAVMIPVMKMNAKQLDKTFNLNLLALTNETCNKLKKHVIVIWSHVEGTVNQREYDRSQKLLLESTVKLTLKIESVLI